MSDWQKILRDESISTLEELRTFCQEAGREEWFMEVVCPVNHKAYLRLVEESMQRRMER